LEKSGITKGDKLRLKGKTRLGGGQDWEGSHGTIRAQFFMKNDGEYCGAAAPPSMRDSGARYEKLSRLDVNGAIRSNGSYTLSRGIAPNSCAIGPLRNERPGTHESILVIRNLGCSVNDRLIGWLVWQI
jgi:hypothetical protein